MSGRHEGPPLGSAAREATAPPYVGKRRAEDWRPYLPETTKLAYMEGTAAEVAEQCIRARAEVAAALAALDEGDWPPDDPPRCGSCGHHLAGECGCTCCTWDEHQERPADV